MMTLAELRKKYRAATPIEVLENLAAIVADPRTPEDYMPPILTIQLCSGGSFRAYLVNAAVNGTEPSFVFSLEVVNETDGAADLCYTMGKDIEAVTVWNVDDYKGILPRITQAKASR